MTGEVVVRDHWHRCECECQKTKSRPNCRCAVFAHCVRDNSYAAKEHHSDHSNHECANRVRERSALGIWTLSESASGYPSHDHHHRETPKSPLHDWNPPVLRHVKS